MAQINLKTDQEKQVVDLTDRLNQELKNQDKEKGLCFIFALHTTCCLTTADLDPGTDQDYLKAIEKMFPKGNYQHPHDPSHVGDHIMSSITGPSVLLPFKNKQLQLGTWQRVVLIELNGPRQRSLIIKTLDN